MKLLTLTLLVISQFYLCKCSLVQDNVVFQKVNDIYIDDNRWLVTLVHDLKPYSEFLGKLKLYIDQTHRVINKMVNFYQNKNLTGYMEAFKSFEIESQLLVDTYESVLGQFDQYGKMQSNSRNQKRSLLPIVGKALSFLFGVVSDSDLVNINRNVNLLARNQQRIIHDLNVSMTFLNLTMSQVSENRRSIIDIVRVINKMDSKIHELNSMFEEKFVQLEQFIHTYLQFELILDDTKLLMQNVVTYLDNLKLELSLLSMNRLSVNTISPNDLRQLLTDIESNLEIGYKLPIDPKENIWYFYNSLYCTAFLSNERIQFVLNIPVVHIKHIYEVYNIINLPIPMINEKFNDDPLAFKYKLESKFLMITKDRTKYSLLPEEEADTCIITNKKFCNPKVPLFSTNLSKTCIIALFLGNTEKITSNCLKVIVQHSLPNAKFIHDGIWIISTDRLLKFTVYCKGQNSKIINVNPPLFMLQLNDTCSAVNAHLTLPVFNNKIVTNVFRNVAPPLSKFENVTSFHIWREMQNFTNLTSMQIPSYLKSLHEIPVHDLFNNLQQDFTSVPKLSESSQDHISLFIMFSIAISITIFVCIFKFKKCNICTLAKNRFVKRNQKRRVDETTSIADEVEIEMEDMCQRTQATITPKGTVNPLLSSCLGQHVQNST